MTEEQASRIFKSFSQADDSITRKYGGTGLGLSISKNLTSMMNGKIWVDSKPGIGSTFNFTAMFGLTDITEITHNAQTIEKKSEYNFNGVQVLLVDDSEMNQQVAKELLEMVNIKVYIANDGKECVEAIKIKNFDAVLMDTQMPVMDGCSATREIRKIPDKSKLPIISMTANVIASDRQKCFEAGMNDHISKPINPSELFSVLSKWIDNKG